MWAGIKNQCKKEEKNAAKKRMRERGTDVSEEENRIKRAKASEGEEERKS